MEAGRMKFYKDEKARVNYDYKWGRAALFFFNIINYLFLFSTERIDYERQHGIQMNFITPDANFISFFNIGIWGGGTIILVYLNFRLFWIREQGELVFLMKKYEILPISTKDIFQAKWKIMVQAGIAYLIWNAGFYAGVMLLNLYPMVDARRLAGEFLFSAVTLGTVLLLLGVWNVVTYLWMEKNGG